MKTSRNLLVVVLVVVSSLFAIQSAGATFHANLAQGCDDIGPLPFRLTTLGLSVGSASMAAPACLDMDVPAEDAADEDAAQCKAIGPTALRLVPVTGLGVSGSGASLYATACMVAPNLLQPAYVPDLRLCEESSATMPPVQPCWSTD